MSFERVDDHKFRMTAPVTAKVVITADMDDMGDVPIFVGEPVQLRPGEELRWCYPEDGITVTIT